MATVTVRIGQIWQSTDTRDHRRTMMVESFSPKFAYMRCTATGRRSTIRIDRLKPTNGCRGYKLLEDAGENDGEGNGDPCRD